MLINMGGTQVRLTNYHITYAIMAYFKSHYYYVFLNHLMYWISDMNCTLEIPNNYYNRRRETPIRCKATKYLKTCTREEAHRFYKGNNIIFPSWTVQVMSSTFCCQPSQRHFTLGLCFKITCLRTILSLSFTQYT